MMNEMVQELVRFCEEHRHIYLYGAGLHAEICYELLEQRGINITGFITTKKEKSVYMDFPVYSVEEVRTLIGASDGIIPAFWGAKIDELAQYFTFEKPDFYPLDQKMIIKISSYHTARKMCIALKKEYGVSNVWVPNVQLKEILVVRTDVMGDLICTIPFIRELKRNYPNANISLVIRDSNYPLVEACPYIKRVVIYKEKVREGGLYEQCRKLETLKEVIETFLKHEFTDIHFDAVFLPRELLSGRNMIDDFLFAFCSRAEYRVGHIIKCEWEKELLYEVVKDCFSLVQIKDGPMHEAEYPLDMLKACGLKVTETQLELWPQESCLKKAESIILEKNMGISCVLCAVGIVGREKKQNWKAENYQQLFHIFKERYGAKYKFILFGGKDAVATAEKIGSSENVIDLTGKLPLGVTVALIKLCHMYIGSNTGLLHIASAFQKSSVILNSSLADEEEVFSAGPIRWGAYGVKNKYELVPPTGLDGCRGVCRKTYSHCINQITAEQVAVCIEKLSEEI